MWNEPYLETCCRSALHRLTLCGAPGRPAGLKDGPCLTRLAGMGLAAEQDGRYHPTAAGRARHGTEILKQPTPSPAVAGASASAGGRSTPDSPR